MDSNRVVVVHQGHRGIVFVLLCRTYCQPRMGAGEGQGVCGENQAHSLRQKKFSIDKLKQSSSLRVSSWVTAVRIALLL